MDKSQAAAVERFMTEALASGDQHRELTLSADHRFTFERGAQPGVLYEAAQLAADGAVKWRRRVFAPGATPAPSYPGDTPFVAGARVSASYSGGASIPVLTWETADDPRVLASALVAECRRQGWAPPPGAAPRLAQAASGMLSGIAKLAMGKDVAMHVLARGDQRRLIQASGPGGGGSGGVTMFDFPAASAKDGGQVPPSPGPSSP